MFKMMILASLGYAVLTAFMISVYDYMDAFVSLTITFIFIFGFKDALKNDKAGTAHAITGSLIGLIFGAYYIVEILSLAFDSLINDGHFKFKPVSTFVITLILISFNLFIFYKYKTQLKSKK